MIRVLHSAFMVSAPAGVQQQMAWEQDAANFMGIRWRSVLYCLEAAPDTGGVVVFAPKASVESGGSLAWIRLRCAYYSWLEEEIGNWDLVLLRHSMHDPFQVRFLKKYGHKIFLVHHTKELQELRSGGWSLAISAKYMLEKWCGWRSIKISKGIVGVTPEILDYEISRVSLSSKKNALLYPNGIFVDDVNFDSKDSRGDIPEFLFVASYFSPWHGLDLLLKGLNGNKSPFILHLVGDLSNKDLLVAQADFRVKIHGRLTSQQIEALSRRCWIGLSSFALQRTGMKQACTLKVREYLINGLPVYAGYDEVLPKGFKFYRTGDPDISAILAYAKEMRIIGRREVRETALPFISKKILLGNLYKEILSKVSGPALNR